jgi:hypothetical protein
LAPETFSPTAVAKEVEVATTASFTSVAFFAVAFEIALAFLRTAFAFLVTAFLTDFAFALTDLLPERVMLKKMVNNFPFLIQAAKAT